MAPLPLLPPWHERENLVPYYVCGILQYNQVPMAERSKARVCGRSLAGIAASNPAGGMDVSLLSLLCTVRQRSLRRADHSSRVVLPNVMRLSVIVNPLNAKLNPICHLLALLGAHHVLHVSRIRVKPQ